MEKEIEFIKEMKKKKISRKRMEGLFYKEFSKFVSFDGAWDLAHKVPELPKDECSKCEKLKALMQKAEEMGYDNLFIKTIKKVLR